MHGTKASNLALGKCDLLIALGARFSDRVAVSPKHFAPNAKVLHIDIDAAEINKNIHTDAFIVGDLKEVLHKLNGRLPDQKHDAWKQEVQKLKQDFPLNYDRSKLTCPFVIEEIDRLTEGKALITTDVGQHQMWAAQYYPVNYARTFLTSGSLGTMGFGLPAAIGAALANPKKRVICITGDGSILMNVQELITLSEQNLNVTVIVLQNGSLGMVHQQQEYLFNKNYSASEFDKVPDFLKLAEGFQLDGVDVEDDEQWYKKAFAPGPHLVRLNISMKENVLPFVKAGTANIDSLRN
jgi:acetolactate synthase-1/2/3 large subunit